ncbi:MAG: hypothetical protein P8130_07280 [Deltaproteobacteria bacterium]
MGWTSTGARTTSLFVSICYLVLQPKSKAKVDCTNMPRNGFNFSASQQVNEVSGVAAFSFLP